MLVQCIIVLGILVLTESQITWNFDSDPGSIFHGYIIEKSQEIFVYPPLHVNLAPTSKLCHLHLLPTATHAVPNFISTEVSDAESGRAKLVLNESALYDDRLRGNFPPGSGVFHLKVVGEDCNHPHHRTKPWALNLLLVPTEQPVWAERHYTFQVDSNLPAGDIVGKVTAYAALDPERGLENRLGDDTGMCNYAIDHPDNNLFDINGHGVIRSRIPLQRHSAQIFSINVTAFDCHTPVPRRSTVRVDVIVRTSCTIEWKGIEPELIYTALPQAHLVSPNAILNACEDHKEQEYCEPKEATLRVKLLWSREDSPRGKRPGAGDNADDEDDEDLTNSTEDLTSVCDFDNLSVRAHAQSCGLFADSVKELLPPKEDSPFVFNGHNQSDIPIKQLSLKQHRLDNVPFTLTFWMRHDAHSPPVHPTSQDEANGREHVVCASDEEEKNRHHFAVYVHNCKLAMLLRREPVNQKTHEQVRLYPSQWRFSVDDVCDNQWHHYALTFRPPPTSVVQGLADETDDWTVETQVKLLIDGDPIPVDGDLIQITEDVPMHLIRQHSTQTRMTIGACWHSRVARYVQHFTGELAAMMLQVGAQMPEEQIQCLANCYPRLHVTGPLNNAQLPDLPPLHQSRLDNLIVQANHLTDLTDLMQHVIFFNPRIRSLPKRRPEPIAIRLTTSITNPSHCQPSTVPDLTIRLVRLPITETVKNSVWTREVHVASQSSVGKSQSTGQLISTTGRIVPKYSLVLRSGRSLKQPITISSTALVQGVWLFPSTELSWIPLARPNDAEEVALNHTVSNCDVDLCPAEPNDHKIVQFARQETITIGTEFLPPGLHVEQSSNGMRFRGPVRADQITQILQHLKWFNRDYEPPRRRCFKLICLASADSRIGPPLMVQSNVLQVVFEIEPTGERVRPRIAKALKRVHYAAVPPLENPAKTIVANQQAIPIRQSPLLQSPQNHPAELVVKPTEPNMNDPTWNQSLNVTYTLMGFAIAIVFISIAVGVTHFFRVRSKTNSRAPTVQKRGWAPMPHMEDIVQGPVPPKVSTNPSAIVKRPPAPKNTTLEVIVNPTTHRKEFEEMENKFCFYDRKLYDEDDEDTLDPDNPAFQDTIYDSEQARTYRSYVTGDDPHEDVSDFDVASDRGTQSVTSAVQGVKDSASEQPEP